MSTKKKKNLRKVTFENTGTDLRVDALQAFVTEGYNTPAKLVTWFGKRHGLQISREDVYRKLLPWAHDMEVFRLLPPPERVTERMLGEEYGQNAERLLVVNSSGDALRLHIATASARLILRLIMQVAQHKEVVHIGLGGGRTVREVSEELAILLQGEPWPPKLAFHALSSGFDVGDPTSAPITFMSYFKRQQIPTEPKFYGLFTRPFVEVKSYDKIRRSTGVAEAVTAAKLIDIVITSCATEADEHGALRRFAEVGGKTKFAEEELRKAGWTGDCQYEPFGPEGPIPVTKGFRAFALFGLRELAALVRKKNKHVVVVGAPCGQCRDAKVAALRPLLSSPKLACWSHLVTDIGTAKLLLPESKTTRRVIYV